MEYYGFKKSPTSGIVPTKRI
jgi:hypothetical protein